MASYTSRRARKHRQKRITWGLVLAVLLTLVGVGIYDALNPQPGQAMADLGNAHIAYPQTATYNSSPPTSGPHYTMLARWGIHTEPIPNELQVHNLEDGGVMVQYNCPEACPELVAQLAGVVERYDTQVILAPYPDMEARIALTAWGRIDTFEEFDEARITRFIQAYRGLDYHR
jgi:hypothetical protein